MKLAILNKTMYSVRTACPHPKHVNKIIGPFPLKSIYSCPIEVISGITDKGQFQYPNGLKGSQEGNYLYRTQYLT